jgi:hypothetical protein
VAKKRRLLLAEIEPCKHLLTNIADLHFLSSYFGNSSTIGGGSRNTATGW